MVIWGRNTVEEAVKSGRVIEKVYLQYGKFFEPEFLQLMESKKVRFQWVKKKQLEKLTGTTKHQGIAAVLSPIRYVSDEELFKLTVKKGSFFVVLDGITDPQNLGTIARTVESFGGIGLLLPVKGSAPINEVAVKSSSGAILHLKVSRVSDLTTSLIKFKTLRGKIYAVETGGRDIRKVAFNKPLALIVGAEGRGVSRELLELSDEIVTIPLLGKTPSLNVSVAAGIAVWNVIRQFL